MFTLLDLPSQAIAVQHVLRGRSAEEKIKWLKAQGTIKQIPKTTEDERQTYFFVSSVGRECAFFIHGDDFVFITDNTTYVVRE